MTRILATVVALAVLAMAGTAHAAPPFFIAYARTTGPGAPCDLGATDPANYQGGNPSLPPVLPPAEIPVGPQTTLELCYLVWPVADSPGTETICQDGTGTESCAERLKLVANGGVNINSFTPVAPSGGEEFPEYQSILSGSSLVIMGGDPIGGQQGAGTTGIHVGTVSLTGLTASGTFELHEASYVDASMQRAGVPAAVIATTLNNCGNSVVDAGEACDDGNETWGDGCAPGCSNEVGFSLVGQAGTSGTITVEIDGISIEVDLSTLPNAPADEVILALVARINSDPNLVASAAQVDDPTQAGGNDGRRIVTNGAITGGPTLDAPGSTITVPEPHQWVLLGTGIAFLLTLGRRRARSA